MSLWTLCEYVMCGCYAGQLGAVSVQLKYVERTTKGGYFWENDKIQQIFVTHLVSY